MTAVKRVVAIGLFVRGLVHALLPPLPHCNQSYSDTIINYFAQNLNDASIYNLGDAASSDDCHAKCSSLNYVCGASGTNPNILIFDSGGTLTFNNPSCELTIDAPGSGWVDILLTPDFNASSNEYIIDLNLTFISGGEAGLIFKRPWAEQPGYYAGLHARNFIGIGVDENNDWQEYAIPSADITSNTRYHLQIHRLPNDLWTVSLDGVPKWTSPPSQKVTFPRDHVGIYADGAHIQVHSLTVSFPSSVDEALCAAYMYNKHNFECSAYFGSDYSALYTSLTVNSSYDSGIIEYAACPTTTSLSPYTSSSTSLSTSSSTQSISISVFQLILLVMIISLGSLTFVLCICFIIYKRCIRKQQKESVGTDVDSHREEPVSFQSDVFPNVEKQEYPQDEHEFMMRRMSEGDKGGAIPVWNMHMGEVEGSVSMRTQREGRILAQSERGSFAMHSQRNQSGDSMFAVALPTVQQTTSKGQTAGDTQTADQFEHFEADHDVTVPGGNHM